MFDAITIRGSDSYAHNSIDPGSFAEALLFYQTVHLVLDSSNIAPLIQKIGIDNFRYLLDSHLCTATYFTDMIGTKSDVLFGSLSLLYDFVAPQLHRRKDETKPLRGRDFIVDTLSRSKELNIPKGKIERLSERMAVKNNSDLTIANKGMLQSARADLNDRKYLRQAIASLLSELVPEFQMGSNNFFEIDPHPQGFLVRTNLDFEKLSSFYKDRVPITEGTLNPATLLTQLLSVRRDLSLALKYGTDIAVSDRSSRLLQFRIDGILSKRFSSVENINRFHEMILPGIQSIREAINSGELQFSDYLRVLEEAKKFKSWLKGVPPDVNLVTEYYKEISKNDWLSRLPVKSVRFAIFSALGLGAGAALSPAIGIGVTAALDATDTFLVEKILRGWTPNQFVEGKLKRTLSSN